MCRALLFLPLLVASFVPAGYVAAADPEPQRVLILAAGETFDPAPLASALQGILAAAAGSSAGQVLVRAEDCRTSVTGQNGSGYSSTWTTGTLMGWYYQPDLRAAHVELLRQRWDRVVLIDHSWVAGNDAEWHFEGILQLAGLARANGAEPMLLMPWPTADGLVHTPFYQYMTAQADLAAFSERAYRVGEGTGCAVIPAGHAWASLPAALRDETATRPSRNGAYLAAAAIFSRITERSAKDAGFLPAGMDATVRDSLADAALATVRAEAGRSHYSGHWNGSRPAIHNNSNRVPVVAQYSPGGSSTEGGMRNGLQGTARTIPGLVPDTGYSQYSHTDGDGHSAPPGDTGDVCFTRVIGWTAPLYYMTMSFDYQPDNGAFDVPRTLESSCLYSENDPDQLRLRLLISRMRIHNPQIPMYQTSEGSFVGHHLSHQVNASVGAMAIAMLSGRCAVRGGAYDAVDDFLIARRTGYEIAWQHNRLQARVPSFWTGASAAELTSTQPIGTIRVRFDDAPTAPVTVTVASSNPALIIAAPVDLVFTPEDYRRERAISIIATPQAAAVDGDITLTTSSADVVFDELVDRWNFRDNYLRTGPVVHAPEVDDLALATDFGVAKAFTVAGRDADGNALTWRIVASPAHGALSGNLPTQIYTPAEGWFGTDSYRVRVSDGTAVDLATVTITTQPPAILPLAQLLEPAAPLSAFGGQRVPLVARPLWQEPGRVEFLVDGRVVAVATAEPWSAVWTAGAVGTHTLVARVVDGAGRQASSAPLTVTVTVGGCAWSNPAGGAWGEAGNWAGGTIADASAVARFDLLDIVDLVTVRLAGTRTLGGLHFGDTLCGGQRWLPAVPPSPTPVVAGDDLGGWRIVGGSGDALVLTGARPELQVDYLGSVPEPFVPAPGDLQVAMDCELRSANGLTKTGPGTLVLGRANPALGPVAIADGQVLVAADGALPGPVELRDGASLGIAPGIQAVISGAITLTGSGATTYRILTARGALLTIHGRIDGSAAADGSSLMLGAPGGTLVCDGGIALGNRDLYVAGDYPRNDLPTVTRIFGGTVTARNLIANKDRVDGAVLYIGGSAQVALSGALYADSDWGGVVIQEGAQVTAARFDHGNNTSYLRLDGGTARVDQVAVSGYGFQGNGGTLVVRSAGDAFLGGNVAIQNGGLTIDTDGKAAGVTAALGGSGPLTKTGLGTLSLLTATTGTGPVRVLGGTLRLAATGTLAQCRSLHVAAGAVLAVDANNALHDAAALRLDAGATVALAAGVNDTVGALQFGEAQQAAGTWGAPGSGAAHQDARFSGNGILTVAGAPVLRAVTVVAGSGGGSFPAGMLVVIAANTPAPGQEFDSWRVDSGGATLVNAQAACTVLTVPTAACQVTALFRAASFPLTVNAGTGGGRYAAGIPRSITANTAPAGQVFDRWVVELGTPALANAQAASTTLTMPATAVVVRATYRTPSAVLVPLTVIGGSGGGSYLQGTVVPVQAEERYGWVLDRWEVTSGTPVLDNAEAASTYLAMPAAASAISVRWRPTLVPEVPTGLRVEAVTISTVRLVWSDVADNTGRFIIERQGANGTWNEVATTAVAVCTWTDTGLSQSTDYRYRVRAENVAGSSAPSAEVAAHTERGETAPEAIADGFHIRQYLTLVVAAPGLLANDRDADGDPIQVLAGEVTTTAGGTATLAVDGSFRYQPAAGFSGTDHFTYRISDGTLSSAPAEVTVEVTANQLPQAEPANRTVAPGATTTIVIATSDADGDAVSCRLGDAPRLGTILNLQPLTGTVTYQAPADGGVVDTFTVIPNDGYADGAADTITVSTEPAAAVDGGSDSGGGRRCGMGSGLAMLAMLAMLLRLKPTK